MNNVLKHAGLSGGRDVPAAIPIRLGMPTLAAAVFLAVLVLGVACWIISSDDRTGRVNRMMLARRGDARCLEAGAPAPPSPASRLRRQSIRSERQTAKTLDG